MGRRLGFSVSRGGWVATQSPFNPHSISIRPTLNPLNQGSTNWPCIRATGVRTTHIVTAAGTAASIDISLPFCIYRVCRSSRAAHCACTAQAHQLTSCHCRGAWLCSKARTSFMKSARPYHTALLSLLGLPRRCCRLCTRTGELSGARLTSSWLFSGH